MDKTAELLDRIAALELRIAQLEARPQPAMPVGKPETVFGAAGTQMMLDFRYNYGSNVSRETFEGPNGAGGPK